MKRIPHLLVLVSLALFGATGCQQSPTEPPGDLVGLWNLAHREAPSVFGYISAQVIFRDNGSFFFVGTNPLSQSILPDFRIDGTWSRTGASVTLDTGDEARTWVLSFEGEEVTFTDPRNGESFTLFRPAPD